MKPKTKKKVRRRHHGRRVDRARVSFSLLMPVNTSMQTRMKLLDRALRRLTVRPHRQWLSTTTTTTTSSSPKEHGPTSLVVALSGGVDSSVAAALLHRQYGDAVTAIHMSNWNVVAHDDDSVPQCSSEQDWKDACQVAQHLDLLVERRRFEAEYWNHVFEPYLEDLLATSKMGNPDVSCNRFVKFGALKDYIQKRHGPDCWLATGHYARLWHRCASTFTTVPPPEHVQEALDQDTVLADWIRRWGLPAETSDATSHTHALLLAAADKSKDQSYFLASCEAESLRNVIFPLGDYHKKRDPQNKPTVRDLAASLELPTAHKRDSMGICFVGKRATGFRHFLSDYLPTPTVQLNFVDVDSGTVVATSAEPEHAALYTVGQGAKLSGTPQRYFVVAAEPATATVWVCAGTHHAALYADSLQLSTVHWMASNQEMPRPLQERGEMRVQCRIRHLQPLMDCTLIVHGKSDKDGTFITVLFDKPVRGIAPGQTAVFYVGNDGLFCLGSGPIQSRGPTYHERGWALPTAEHLAASGSNDLSVLRQTMTASGGE